MLPIGLRQDAGAAAGAGADDDDDDDGADSDGVLLIDGVIGRRLIHG